MLTWHLPSPALTPGEDLHKVLWLKSRNSEVWLERRTSYTRSTAVMSMVRQAEGLVQGGGVALPVLERQACCSMHAACLAPPTPLHSPPPPHHPPTTHPPHPLCLQVGYILGLGDRHPSNLMLDRYSGAEGELETRGDGEEHAAGSVGARALKRIPAGVRSCRAPPLTCAHPVRLPPAAGKLLHIDFGDCFEASMNREKFPEKVGGWVGGWVGGCHPASQAAPLSTTCASSRRGAAPAGAGLPAALRCAWRELAAHPSRAADSPGWLCARTCRCPSA